MAFFKKFKTKTTKQPSSKKNIKKADAKAKTKPIKKVIVKVPAKVIISGEHAVVFNKTAVVCAIDMYMLVKIKKIHAPKIIVKNNISKSLVIDLQDFSIEKKNENVVLEILRRFFDKTKSPMCGMKISIKTSIPVGEGFGSSAALINGIVFGLNELFETKKKTNDLIKMATNIENLFHGNSSGIDISAIALGGVIYANYNDITKISHHLDEIWLVNTGCPSFSTKNVVHCIYDNFADKAKLWKEFENVSTDIAEILQSKEKLNQKITHNENLLEKIGIVLPQTKLFIDELKKNGIYAKVCGAGTIAKNEIHGGNGVVGIFQPLTNEQLIALKTLCKKHRFTCIKCHIANAGVSIIVKR